MSKQNIPIPQKVHTLKQAIRLYRGSVFASFCDDHWVVGIATEYKMKYIGMVNDLLALLGNYYGPTLIVAPITSRYYKKSNQPTHYALVGVDNLLSPSMVLAEQIVTIDKSRVIKYIGKVSDEQMEHIDKTLEVSLALDV